MTRDSTVETFPIHIQPQQVAGVTTLAPEPISGDTSWFSGVLVTPKGRTRSRVGSVGGVPQVVQTVTDPGPVDTVGRNTRIKEAKNTEYEKLPSLWERFTAWIGQWVVVLLGGTILAFLIKWKWKTILKFFSHAA